MFGEGGNKHPLDEGPEWKTPSLTDLHAGHGGGAIEAEGTGRGATAGVCCPCRPRREPRPQSGPVLINQGSVDSSHRISRLSFEVAESLEAFI